MGSVFMPEDFKHTYSTVTDVKLASIAWGFTLGFTVLTVAKAGSQTLKIWRRTKRVTTYLAMIWLEVLVNSVLGLISWLFINGIIIASFIYFFVAVSLWCLELHLLIQIIVNRISLLVVSKHRIRWIKWVSCAVVLVINIGVYCIWIPARLQISPTFIYINHIFDRCEKVIYLLLDAGLNFYFCYLVRMNLLAAGMEKYRSLYKFNLVIVFVSLSMDVLLIGTMSLHNDFIYMQFHPLCYMVKLNIEMSMAHMISKVARIHWQGKRLQRKSPRNVKMIGIKKAGSTMVDEDCALECRCYPQAADNMREIDHDVWEQDVEAGHSTQDSVDGFGCSGRNTSQGINTITKTTTVEVTQGSDGADSLRNKG